MTFVAEELYSEFIKALPLVCIDIIVSSDHGFLLIKRNDEPLKNIYWVPGGRLNQGERLVSAARRKLFEECGLNLPEERFRYRGIYEDLFDCSSFGRHQYHTISVVFEVFLADIKNVSLDGTSSDWRLETTLPERFETKLEFNT